MFTFGHFENVYLMQKIFQICSRVAFADLTSENFFKIARGVLLLLPPVTKIYQIIVK